MNGIFQPSQPKLRGRARTVSRSGKHSMKRKMPSLPRSIQKTRSWPSGAFPDVDFTAFNPRTHHEKYMRKDGIPELPQYPSKEQLKRMEETERNKCKEMMAREKAEAIVNETQNQDGDGDAIPIDELPVDDYTINDDDYSGGYIWETTEDPLDSSVSGSPVHHI